MAVALVIALLHALRCLRDPYFFWRDDFQTHYLPGSLEITTAWLQGEVPLLSRHSWFAGAFAGEYQYGVFSPFLGICHLAIWHLGLDLPTVAAGFSIVHLALAGAGAYLLGRSYGLAPFLSGLVALVASSNGWVTAWAAAWYPSLASFAWIPWLWLGLRALTRRVSGLRVALCALTLFLVLAAGWPFTVLMAMVLVVAHVAPLLYQGRLRCAGAIVVSMALGLGLSAPALLMLAEYVAATDRQVAASGVHHMWQVPLAGLLGLILPTFTSWWHGFLIGPHAAVELAGGFVPLTGFTAAAFVLGGRFLRPYARELFIVAVPLVLMLLPSAGVLRWSFRWLPLFHLALALVGALGIRAIQEERVRRSALALATTGRSRTAWSRVLSPLNVGLWALGLMLAGLGVASLRDGSFSATARLAVVYLILVVAWIAVDASEASRARVAFPAAFAAFTLYSIFPYVPSDQSVSTWRITDEARNPLPYHGDVLYMALYRWEDVTRVDRLVGSRSRGHPLYRPGNVPMLAGLSFVNGYSPMQPRGLRRLLGLRAHGHLETDHAVRLLQKETGPGALLEHLGVDGVVLHETLASAAGVTLDALEGWRRVATIDGEVLLERNRRTDPARLVTQVQTFRTEEDALSWVTSRASASLPLFMVSPDTTPELQAFCGAGTSRVTSAGRLSVALKVETRTCSGPSLLLLRRPWFPGYRARAGGQELPLVVADLVMPAVVIPAGFAGEVTVEYRPRSLRWGIIAALASLGALLVPVGVAPIRRLARSVSGA